MFFMKSFSSPFYSRFWPRIMNKTNMIPSFTQLPYLWLGQTYMFGSFPSNCAGDISLTPFRPSSSWTTWGSECCWHAFIHLPEDQRKGGRDFSRKDFSCRFSQNCWNSGSTCRKSGGGPNWYHNSTYSVAGKWFVLLLQCVHPWMKSQLDCHSMPLILGPWVFGRLLSEVCFTRDLLPNLSLPK